MKRSEANKILSDRIEFSKVYDAFSCKSDDPYFSHRGCECCHSLPTDVYEVTCLMREDINKKNFDDVYEVEVCGDCLVSLINGDDSDLDYYVTEEDEEKLHA